MDRAVNQTGNRLRSINIYLIWTSCRLSGCDIGVALCQETLSGLLGNGQGIYPSLVLRIVLRRYSAVAVVAMQLHVLYLPPVRCSDEIAHEY